MSAPQRQRPGSASPIKKLTPHVETVRTPSTPTEPEGEGTQRPLEVGVGSTSAAPTIEATPEPSVAGESGPAAQPARAKAPARKAAPKVLVPDPKIPTTLAIRQSLKKKAETAVLSTSRFEGGYVSLSALVEGALVRELERLAEEFNEGQPFEENDGGFRQGRPAGR
ncbi:hypothetical protein GCM10010988_41170 [Cnuibacter physcomitrellae]|uniref:hypothetical protein n=1 Tax=Cnuibacter physcomitrellae TaxID=1619308 RepID=UPI0012F50D8B|nr:hypothetical protein [Cnuibacter physcomitrellae]GGI42864.1 hypothetical protein GCM10010988_41170 [Cnuibacter physcomitrellae]